MMVMMVMMVVIYDSDDNGSHDSENDGCDDQVSLQSADQSLTWGLTGAFGRFNVSSSSATTVPNVMKYGMMAIMSITFMTSLQKCNLFGHARNL